MRREAAHAIIAAKRKWTENNGGIIMEFIREERQTPIKDRCRVLVAGGGYAGVSAALARRAAVRMCCCSSASLSSEGSAQRG